MRKLFQLLFGDAGDEIRNVVAISFCVLCFFVITTGYRDWWIYKAFMGSKAKESGLRKFGKKKKPEALPDTPPEEEPKE